MSTTAAASVNGSNVNGPLNPPTAATSAARPQLKMSAAKGLEGARKQAVSPIDSTAQRKPPKAWSQGTNPITQRSANPSASNGVANNPKPTHTPQSLPSGTGDPMRHLSDRMMFLLANLIGRPNDFTLKNGERYTGVLSGTSLDPSEMRYVFKMVKRVQAGDAHVNGANDSSDDYIGVGDNHVMAFDMGDVAELHVSNVVLDKLQPKGQNGVSSSTFRTDADISGNLALRERTLQRWEPSADTNVDLSLDSAGHSAGWDQFATNEKLFGVTSNYDENIYTTTINYNAPGYAEKAARAARLANEIEGSNPLNAHVEEERGHAATDDKGGDEEEKYSGVRRDFPPLPTGQPNKYTPPARRPPTGQPTVPGAPHDPAIISSQLARPDAKTAQPTATPPSDKRTTPEPPKAESNVKPAAALPAKPEAAKDATNPQSKPAPPAKPAADPTQKPSAALTAATARKSGRQDATATVEHALLDSFKQFSAQEKLRVSERQRTLARESKAVKLNDLKKFSQNFKLNTPVPTDLVPILAKDETKQQQIVEKALRAVQDSKTVPPKPVTAPVEAKATAPQTAKPSATQGNAGNTVDRQARQRPAQNFGGSASMRTDRGQNHNQHNGQMPTRGPGLLSTRLAINQAQHKQQSGLPYAGIPHPIPTAPDVRAPSGPSASSSGVGTPTSAASRFNVRAHEFKPNPAANTFLPGGNSNASTHSSPRPESAPKQEPPRRTVLTSFFGDKRPSVQPLDLKDAFSPLRRLLTHHDEKESGDLPKNGGIPFPFRTLPTWPSKSEKTYTQMLEPASQPPPISAPHNMINNGSMPHQSQLPAHLQGPQGMVQNHTHHTSRHPPIQPHHPHSGHPHFEPQPMQFSHSTSSMHPSPRAVPPYMYSTQPQGMPGFSPQVPMQNYGMSPGVSHVALQPRQGAPQFVNGPVPGMGGHMMTNQPSNGPYMGMPPNPQMQMYSPGPGHAYPHFPNQMTGPPASNGYPSPRPHGAPLMHHQNSQQGHQVQQNVVYVPQGGQVPPMFTQMPPGSMNHMRPYPAAHQAPHFGSPHQHAQFPQQHRGTPSGSYSQPMVQQHSMQPQGPPPTGPSNHGPEGNEDAK